VSEEAAVDFDDTKFKLGGLCKRGHDYQDTGKSLQRISNGLCVECHRENNRERARSKQHVKVTTKRGRPGTIDDATLLSVRVPQALLDRLDEQLEAMRRDLPGVSLTRADVVRSLLEQSLRHFAKISCLFQ
jgi:hypothetical protein